MIFFELSGKMVLFPENMILFLSGKQKMFFWKNILKYYSVKFLLSTNMILSFCQKSKDDLSQKGTLKLGISGIFGKVDIYPRKVKDDNKI